MGPSRPPPTAAEQEEEFDLSFLDAQGEDQDQPPQPPRSPYTATRALMRNLTLPSVPNMDIPPSPPGTPPRGLEALTAKFDTFLRLKRTKGVHFNDRLAAAGGMKNPGVTDKLMGFVGLPAEFTSLEGEEPDRPGQGEGEGEEGLGGGVEQYRTVLSADVWDPACFPAWAYRGPLRKAQERANRERERGRGEPVEFVSSGMTTVVGGGAASAARSRSGTPGVAAASGTGTGTGKRKGRWDT